MKKNIKFKLKYKFLIWIVVVILLAFTVSASLFDDAVVGARFASFGVVVIIFFYLIYEIAKHFKKKK